VRTSSTRILLLLVIQQLVIVGVLLFGFREELIVAPPTILLFAGASLLVIGAEVCFWILFGLLKGRATGRLIFVGLGSILMGLHFCGLLGHGTMSSVVEVIGVAMFLLGVWGSRHDQQGRPDGSEDRGK
jgi:hypothetical protein